ncbi:MAG: class I mannose-6-phosphate isomerase [Bacteroidales bacterium]
MTSNYDKFPAVGLENAMIWKGWESCINRIRLEMSRIHKARKVVVVECYTGVLYPDLAQGLAQLGFEELFRDSDWLKEEAEILALTQPDVTDDQIFGYMTNLRMEDFVSREKVTLLRQRIGQVVSGTVVLCGTGASVAWPEPDLLIYADMARWEIQLRMRRGLVHGLGVKDSDLEFSHQYKRGYFVDWRVCDRHKVELIDRIDFFLDTNRAGSPGLMKRADWLNGLEKTSTRPFRVVPYFDPGPWGGQWMKEVCDLDRSVENYAWCFDCVPEENSLLFEAGGVTFETPAVNLVLFQPENLLGEGILRRLGPEFPIRFDFLDTMEGGNLSFQVHPLKEYIREKLGMPYTQDESYYLLDAREDATVYLGLREGIDREKMLADLKKSSLNGQIFDVDAYVNRWPARKHDHFLIPAGTVHCSGRNSMVLEISSTPYIFTFKMWDWGRMGLDGKPRPINVDHAVNVINWERITPVVSRELINRVEVLAEGEGWREERTGLHPDEPLETRRHWFTGPVAHHTGGTVNVLNLVEGREAVVSSPEGRFEPFTVHYAETFIIPAAVGPYVIAPVNGVSDQPHATIKAFVREQE